MSLESCSETGDAIVCLQPSERVVLPTTPETGVCALLTYSVCDIIRGQRMAHFLTVSDNEPAADAGLQILLDAGHACGWVRSGEGALDVMRWRRPDLLLLDSALPGLPFTQVLRSLHSCAETHDLPVILIVDEGIAGNETLAFRHGAQAQVGTVIHAEILLEIVEKLLQPRTRHEPGYSLIDHLEEAASRWRDSPLKRAMF